ncbi:hypothetical protein HYU17_05235 [Candidatus Woesearchaeota archaeon]|nr:hypothetical protein [Candidatus Woesearchaeota archaeon]
MRKPENHSVATAAVMFGAVVLSYVLGVSTASLWKGNEAQPANTATSSQNRQRTGQQPPPSPESISGTATPTQIPTLTPTPATGRWPELSETPDDGEMKLSFIPTPTPRLTPTPASGKGAQAAATPTPTAVPSAVTGIEKYGAISIAVREDNPLKEAYVGLEMRLTAADNVRHFVDVTLFREGKEINRIGTSVFPNDSIMVAVEGLPAGKYRINVLEKDGVVGKGKSIADVTLSINDLPVAGKPSYKQLLEGLAERDVTLLYFKDKKGAIISEVWYGRSILRLH